MDDLVEAALDRLAVGLVLPLELAVTDEEYAAVVARLERRRPAAGDEPAAG